MKKLKTQIAVNIKDCKISKDLQSYFDDTVYQIDAYHDTYYPNVFKTSHLQGEVRILKHELKESSLTQEERDWNKKIIKEIKDLIALLKANKVQIVYF